MLSPMPETAPPKYTLLPPLAERDEDTIARLATPAGMDGVMYTFANDEVVSTALERLRVMDDGSAPTTMLLVDAEVSVDDDNTIATDPPLDT